MTNNLKFSKYNEFSVLIEWPTIIDDYLLTEILNSKNAIQNKYIKQKVEVINTYNSILVIYNCYIDNINIEILELKALLLKENISIKLNSKIWEIPVCYADEFGSDLEAFSNQKKCSKNDIIQLHTKAIYTVFFIGFLPGFLYLGGLNSELFLDRKTTPNLNVKKGSVAIGGQQTGIYPQDSPGGWHVIGRTPLEMFESIQDPPCFVSAGDKVTFKAVDIYEFSSIQKAVKASKYQLKPIISDA